MPLSKNIINQQKAELTMEKINQGSCLCGAIKFEVTGDLPQPSACHCTQCQKHSGHYEAGTDIPKKSLTVSGNDKITWYQSPKKDVRRGFCSICGSSLFWDPTNKDWIGVAHRKPFVFLDTVKK